MYSTEMDGIYNNNLGDLPFKCYFIEAMTLSSVAILINFVIPLSMSSHIYSPF